MGQTTSKGAVIGWWFNGRPVYEADLQRIQDSGKYVPYTDAVPEGYEAWVSITAGTPRKFARKMNGFKKWWMRNKGALLSDIASAGKIALGTVEKVSSLVLPILLDAGVDAAKLAAQQEFGDNATVTAIVDALSTQVRAAAPGATYVSKMAERTGGHEPRDMYFGSGGVLEKFGGADEDVDMTLLNNYVDSASSKAKKHIVDAVVEVAEGLKMKISGSTPEEKVKSILSNLPKPENFKKEQHKVACEALAMRLNKAYGSQIIQMSAPAEVICGQVAEVLASLSSGMHSEFISVYNDARRILRNLQLLNNLLGENHKKLIAELRAGGEGSQSRIANYEDIYNTIKGEITRQTSLITGLINGTLSPVDEELTKLMRAGGVRSLYEQINLDKVGPGHAQFSKFLAELVKGMGVTGHFAALIENALKTVGITMGDYAAAKSTQEFREKIAKGMSSRDMNDKQFDEYLRAAELLFDNLERRKEIAEAATKSGAAEPVVGGAEYEKTAAEKAVANRKLERKLYFNTFHKEVNALFDGLLENINVLSNKVGTEIPLSENLDQFRRCLQRISSDDSFLRNGKIHYALLGYYADATSRQKKEDFLGKLKMLSSAAATVAEMGAYAGSKQYFTDICSQIAAIIKLIDGYSDKIAQRFGRGETEITGGFEGGAGLVDDEPRLKYRSSKSIGESIDMFDFKYRLAHIRDNIKISATETPKYFEGHDNLVALSISELLKKEQDIYNEEIKLLEADQKAATNVPGDVALATETARKASFEASKKLLDEIWETKKAFWVTIEAVDAYMREFTNGLIRNPDDVRDIRSMVENVEVIAEWYNEKSGNNLFTVFDKFPESLAAAPNGLSAYKTGKYDGKEHPYASLETNSTPGNPYVIVSPTEGIEIQKSAESAVRSFGLLKNFIAIFNKIGAKFGGEALSKKIPMTPATMYENLVRYIKTSAFTRGLHQKNSDGVIIRAAGFQVTTPIAAGVANTGSTDLSGLFRSSYGLCMRSVDPTISVGEHFSFTKEDDYFVMAIKALAAKILTIASMQNVLSRPANYNSLSTARVILGAGDEIPKVENDVAVYLRLLLLAQFYRKIFSLEGADPDTDNDWAKYTELPVAPDHNTVKISMVPDLDGKFSEVIRLVFRKNRYTLSQNLSDDEMKEWIRAVNKIYQQTQSSGKTDVTNTIIQEFVAEINRRYGIISEANDKIFRDELKSRYNYYSTHSGYPSDVPETELPLLDGEGDDLPDRPSASTRLLADSLKPAEAKKSKYGITKQHYEMIKKFRNIFEKYFESIDDTETLGTSITLTQAKLKQTQDDAQRFALVSKLVRGVDIYNKIDAMKYVFFHETVVSSLDALSTIHTLLSRFRQVAAMTDVEMLVESMASGHSGPSSGAVLAAAKKALADSGLFTDSAQYDRVNHFVDAADRLINGAGVAHVYGPANYKEALVNYIADNKKTHADLVHIRYGISFNAVMREILETLFMLTNTSGGLIESKIQDGKIYINFNGIKKLVEEMLAEVFHHVELIRPHISEDLVNKYIDKTKPGSYFWLHEQLIEKMFVGRPDAARDPVNKKYATLDECAKIISKSYEIATMEWPDDLNAGSHQIPSVNKRISYGDLFAEMTFYDCRVIESGVTASSDAIGGAEAGVIEFKTNPYEGLHVNIGTDGKSVLDTRYTIRFKQLYSWKEEFNCNRSALFAFNQLVARFIHNTFDPVTNKMYAGALNNFNQSLFNRAILDHTYTYPDMVPGLLVKYPDLMEELGDLDDAYAQFVTSTDLVNMDLLKKVVESMNANIGTTSPFFQFTLDDLMKTTNIKRTTGKHYGPAVMWMICIFMAANLMVDFVKSFNNSSVYAAMETQVNKLIKAEADAEGERDKHRDELAILNNLQAYFSSLSTTPAPIDSTYVDNANLANDRVTSKNIVKTVSVGSMYNPAEITNVLNALKNAGGKLSISAATKAATDAQLDLDNASNNLADGQKIAELEKLIADGDTLDKKGEYHAIIQLGDMLGTPITKYDDIVKFTTATTTVAAVINKLAAKAGVTAAITEPDLMSGVKLESLIDQLDAGNPKNFIRMKIDSMTKKPAVGDTVSMYYNMAVVPDLKNYYHLIKYIYRKTQKAPETTGAHFAEIAKLLDKKTPLENLSTFYNLLLALGNILSQKPAKKHERDPELYQRRLVELRKVQFAPPTKKTRGQSEISITAQHADVLNVSTDKYRDHTINLSMRDKNVLFAARAEAITGNGSRELVGKNSIEFPQLGRVVQPPSGTDPAQNNIDNVLKFGKRGDPDGDHVLYTSLAHIIRQLVSTRTAAGSPYYLQENIADIPAYMKERMRGNLPGFAALFTALIQRCEFLKKLLDRSEVDVSRDNANKPYPVVPGGAKAPFVNPYPYVLLEPWMSDPVLKLRYIGILDAISKGCAAFVKSCEQVLRELGDTEVYLETYQGSVKDYKVQNGVDQFMPLSSILAVANNKDVTTHLDFYPFFTMGETRFKFGYGTRLLLNKLDKQPLLEHAPGFMQIVDSFNMLADDKFKEDKKHAESVFKQLTTVARFIHESRHLRASVSSYTRESMDDVSTKTYDAMVAISTKMNVAGTDLILPAGSPTVSHGPPVVVTNQSLFLPTDTRQEIHKSAYAIGRTLEQILRITESTAKDDKIKEFVSSFSSSSKSTSSLEVRNIIDLNIVPINVHALSREIPLATLYNYSYTFDRLVCEEYLDDPSKANEFIDDTSGGKISNTMEFMVALMINPYMKLKADYAGDDEEHTLFLHRMMVGSTNNELGRPKYLSDQVFNKSLYGELFVDPDSESANPSLRVATDLRSQKTGQTANVTDVTKTIGTAVGKVVSATSAATVGVIGDALGAAIIAVQDGKRLGFVDDYCAFIFTSTLWLGMSATGREYPMGATSADITTTMKTIQPAGGYVKYFGKYGLSGRPRNDTLVTIIVNTLVKEAASADISAETAPLPSPDQIHKIGIQAAQMLSGAISKKSSDLVTTLSYPSSSEKETTDRLATLRAKVSRVSVKNRADLYTAGLARFDTKLIRNIVFITNVYRTVSHILRKSLSYVGEDITRSMPAISDGMTELVADQVKVRRTARAGKNSRFDY